MNKIVPLNRQLSSPCLRQAPGRRVGVYPRRFFIYQRILKKLTFGFVAVFFSLALTHCTPMDAPVYEIKTITVTQQIQTTEPSITLTTAMSGEVPMLLSLSIPCTSTVFINWGDVFFETESVSENYTAISRNYTSS